jgi:uncharacterized protein (TIGR00369 family)
MNDGNRPLVEHIFETAKFVRSLGIELLSSGHGWCQTRIAALPSHLQQHGFVHAGVIMTLADHTCGGAAASTVPEEKDVITVETKTSFLRPAANPELTCRAEVLRAGKNLIFVEAEVRSQRNGETVLVAKASSTLAVIPLKK